MLGVMSGFLAVLVLVLYVNSEQVRWRKPLGTDFCEVRVFARFCLIGRAG